MYPESGQRWNLPRAACGGAREQAVFCRGAGHPLSTICLSRQLSQTQRAPGIPWVPSPLIVPACPVALFPAGVCALWAYVPSLIWCCVSRLSTVPCSQWALDTYMEWMKPLPGTLPRRKELFETKAHRQLRKVGAPVGSLTQVPGCQPSHRGSQYWQYVGIAWKALKYCCLRDSHLIGPGYSLGLGFFKFPKWV